MNEQYTFSVFTPTYNRAHTLPRVHTSLTRQTWSDFEWIVVDDGSTDNTKELIENWQNQSTFPIKYYWQQNQGKHIAINKGVSVAQGKLFVIFDSDDACTDNALERIAYHWHSIPSHLKNSFGAIITLCVDQHGQLVGQGFSADVCDETWLDMYYKHGLKGEKWGIFCTKALKEFPFPTTIIRQYIPEGIIWSRMSRKYQTRFINEALRIYYIEGQSMVHYTDPAKNALGNCLEHAETLNFYLDYLIYKPFEFIRSATHYSRFSFHRKIKVLDQPKNLRNFIGKTLWFCMLPVGFAAYLKDKTSKSIHL